MHDGGLSLREKAEVRLVAVHRVRDAAPGTEEPDPVQVRDVAQPGALFHQRALAAVLARMRMDHEAALPGELGRRAQQPSVQETANRGETATARRPFSRPCHRA